MSDSSGNWLAKSDPAIVLPSQITWLNDCCIEFTGGETEVGNILIHYDAIGVPVFEIEIEAIATEVFRFALSDRYFLKSHSFSAKEEIIVERLDSNVSFGVSARFRFRSRPVFLVDTIKGWEYEFQVLNNPQLIPDGETIEISHEYCDIEYTQRPSSELRVHDNVRVVDGLLRILPHQSGS